MIFRLFQTNSLFGYFLVYTLTACLLGLNIDNIALGDYSFVANILPDSIWSKWLLGIIIIAALPVSMVSFLRVNQIHKKSTFFQYFLFLLITYPLVIKGNWLGLMVIPLFIGALHQVMRTYNQSQTIQEAFTSGLLLALASLIEPVAILGLPFYYFMVVVFRSFNLMNLFHLVLGLLSPLLLLYGMDVFGKLHIETYYLEFLSNFGFSLSLSNYHWALLPSGVFALISFLNLFTRVNYLSIRQQLNRYAIIWLALMSVFFVFTGNNDNIGFYSLALATVVPLNYYFKTIKSRFWSDVQLVLVMVVSGYLIYLF